MNHRIITIALVLISGCKHMDDSNLTQTENIFIPSMPWRYDDVTEFQGSDTPWHCGVHSVYRTLSTFGMSKQFMEVAGEIGQQTFRYELLKDVERLLTEKICTKLGPLKVTCRSETRKVTQKATISVDLELGIGKAPHQLAAAIRDLYGIPAVSKEKQDLTELKQHVSEGKPVLALLQVGTNSATLDGISYSFPLLHWVIINGFDAQNIFYLDTTNNTQQSFTEDEFFRSWDWQIGGWNKSSPVHAYLTRAEGLEVRSAIYIEQPVPTLVTANAYWKTHGRWPNELELAQGVSFLQRGRFDQHDQHDQEDFLIRELVTASMTSFFKLAFRKPPTPDQIEAALAMIKTGATLQQAFTNFAHTEGGIDDKFAQLNKTHTRVRSQLDALEKVTAPHTSLVRMGAAALSSPLPIENTKKLLADTDKTLVTTCPLPARLTNIDEGELERQILAIDELRRDLDTAFLATSNWRVNRELWRKHESNIIAARSALQDVRDSSGKNFCPALELILAGLTEQVARESTASEATTLLARMDQLLAHMSLYTKFIAPLATTGENINVYLSRYYAPYLAKQAFDQAVNSLSDLETEAAGIDWDPELRARLERQFDYAYGRIMNSQADLYSALARSLSMRTARKSVVLQAERSLSRRYDKTCIMLSRKIFANAIPDLESELAFVKFQKECSDRP